MFYQVLNNHLCNPKESPSVGNSWGRGPPPPGKAVGRGWGAAWVGVFLRVDVVCVLSQA